MWTPHWPLPLRRDRMTASINEGDDMHDDENIELPEGFELDTELEAELDKIIDVETTEVEPEAVANLVEERMGSQLGSRTVEVLSHVNQYRKGDRFTVPVDEQPWSGMLASGVAMVVD